MPTYGNTAYAPFTPAGPSEPQQSFRINSGNKNTGPYFWNGFYYSSGYFSDAAITNYSRLAVYKSADGITWTPVDQANWPYVGFTDEFYPAAGGSVIYFCYFNADNPLNAILTLHKTAGGALWETGGTGYAVNDTGTINGGTATYLITSVDGGGSVTGISFVSGGVNTYSVATKVGTTTGGGQPGSGTGLVVNINGVSGGNITSLSISNSKGGGGYAVNDTGTINGGGTSATYRVASVDHGVVTGLALTLGGAGYSIASNVATTTGGSQPGAGSGMTVDISAIGGSPGGGNFTPALQLASFDMATNLFTVISTAGPQLLLGWDQRYEVPAGTFDPQIELQLVVRLDGVFVILYATEDAITNFYKINMVTWNGTSWGSPALVSSTGNPNNNGYQPYGTGLTPTDQVYMLWISGDDENLYSSLYHGSTLDAPVLAYTFGAHNFIMLPGTYPTRAYYDVTTDSLIWGFPQRVPFDTTWSVGLLVAASASTSAIFSVVDTGAVSPDLSITRGEMAFVKYSGTYYVYYVASGGEGPPAFGQIDVVSATSLAGSWTGPTVFWDWPTTDDFSPLPVITHPSITDQIEDITISVLPNGPAFIIYREINTGPGGVGVQGSGPQYILLPSPPGPGPLTIACPVGGSTATVGVPYSAQIVVSGGTPPYTFMLL